MSDLRQAAQQALDFIVATNKSSQFWLVPESNLNKTVTALRAALAAAVDDKPRAWIDRWGNYAHPTLKDTAGATPLYTRPAAVAEPVSLETVYETIIHWDEGGGKRSRRELARRIVALYAAPPQREPVEWLTGCPECGMDGGCDCPSGTDNTPQRDAQDLIPPDALFVCGQMGAHVTRVRLAEPQREPTEPGWYVVLPPDFDTPTVRAFGRDRQWWIPLGKGNGEEGWMTGRPYKNWVGPIADIDAEQPFRAASAPKDAG